MHVAGVVILVMLVELRLLPGNVRMNIYLNKHYFTFSGFASIINAAVELGTSAGNSTTGLNDVPQQLSLNNRVQAAIAIGVIIIWTLQNALKIDQQGQISFCILSKSTG
jgi:hypothetical protein